MNAVATILESFELQTRGETVCCVEAGTTFGATAENGRVWFWVEDATKRLHKATLPIDSELLEVRMNKTHAEK